MSGYLTKHVLDTALGGSAAGMTIALFKIKGETRTLLRALTTNADSHIPARLGIRNRQR